MDQPNIILNCNTTRKLLISRPNKNMLAHKFLSPLANHYYFFMSSYTAFGFYPTLLIIFSLVVVSWQKKCSPRNESANLMAMQSLDSIP